MFFRKPKGQSRVNPYSSRRNLVNISFDNIIVEETDSVSSECSEPNIEPNMANPGTPGNAPAPAPALPTINIFNALKIPDAVKDLPKFDGNPRLLHDFIENVEEILTLITAVDGMLCGKTIMRAVRNKIEGQANEVLNMYGTSLEWDSIKTNLILHYSDKRNETSLIKDLHSLKQNMKSVEKFYSEVIETQATMFNHIQIHETDTTVIKAKKDLFSQMCLNIFLTGLREPLGSTIRAMRPDSLPVAFTYCIQEQNIFYIKTDINKSSTPTRNMPMPNPPNKFINHPQQTFRQNRQFTQQNRPFSQNQVFSQQKPFFQNQTFSQQNRPFFQNQTFSQPNRPFFQNRSFPQNNTRFPKPEPMELGSGHSHLRQPTAYQPKPLQNNYNRFPNRELFNINQSYQDNNSYHPQLDYFYNHQNNPSEDIETNNKLNDEYGNKIEPTFEVDDSNFRSHASINLSDT